MLRGAVEEAANEMMKLVISFGGYLNAGDLTANHLADVLNVGIGNSVRQKIGLQQIVVSGDVPGQWNWVKQWVVYWALRNFYRDAFARVGGDRYKVKMDFYKEEMQRRITSNLYTLGIPVVIRPLVRPAAMFERNTGTWDSSNVDLVAGSGIATTPFDVVVTYCDMSQPNFYADAAHPNNCESEPSDIVTVTPDGTQVIEVDITSLNPPSGAQHPSQIMVVVVSPLRATHWNVYIGNQGSSTLYLQNPAPIPIATKTCTLAGDPVLSGYESSNGQYPDRRLSIAPMRQRA